MDNFDAAGIGREQFARRCNSRPYTREEWLAAERALTAALAEIARLTRLRSETAETMGKSHLQDVADLFNYLAPHPAEKEGNK